MPKNNFSSFSLHHTHIFFLSREKWKGISQWKTIICHLASNNGFIDDRFADSTTSESGTWLFLSHCLPTTSISSSFSSLFSIFFLKKISKHLFFHYRAATLQRFQIFVEYAVCLIIPVYVMLFRIKLWVLSINYLEIIEEYYILNCIALRILNK
mgnify:CR=1 FL=1